MSFGQRFIYVGVGGSGQTIGRELEGMLRNQICGPNGNKARLEEKKLPELRAHELPPASRPKNCRGHGNIYPRTTEVLCVQPDYEPAPHRRGRDHPTMAATTRGRLGH